MEGRNALQKFKKKVPVQNFHMQGCGILCHISDLKTDHRASKLKDAMALPSHGRLDFWARNPEQIISCMKTSITMKKEAIYKINLHDSDSTR